jgi:hypothetical protein
MNCVPIIKSHLSTPPRFAPPASWEVFLAEGHLHRSLGRSPRKRRRQETFWPKAIFNVSHPPHENGLRPIEACGGASPGALPQATVIGGLRPNRIIVQTGPPDSVLFAVV